MISLHHTFPSRTPGGFGGVAEWVTTTWLRFNVLVSTLVFVPAVLASPTLSAGERVLMLALAPVGGLVLYFMVSMLFLVMLFTPGPSFIFGAIRLAYVWLFSRLIVQPAPDVEAPLWISGR